MKRAQGTGLPSAASAAASGMPCAPHTVTRKVWRTMGGPSWGSLGCSCVPVTPTNGDRGEPGARSCWE